MGPLAAIPAALAAAAPAAGAAGAGAAETAAAAAPALGAGLGAGLGAAGAGAGAGLGAAAPALAAGAGTAAELGAGAAPALGAAAPAAIAPATASLADVTLPSAQASTMADTANAIGASAATPPAGGPSLQLTPWQNFQGQVDKFQNNPVTGNKYAQRVIKNMGSQNRQNAQQQAPAPQPVYSTPSLPYIAAPSGDQFSLLNAPRTGKGFYGE